MIVFIVSLQQLEMGSNLPRLKREEVQVLFGLSVT